MSLDIELARELHVHAENDLAADGRSFLAWLLDRRARRDCTAKQVRSFYERQGLVPQQHIVDQAVGQHLVAVYRHRPVVLSGMARIAAGLVMRRVPSGRFVAASLCVLTALVAGIGYQLALWRANATALAHDVAYINASHAKQLRFDRLLVRQDRQLAELHGITFAKAATDRLRLAAMTNEQAALTAVSSVHFPYEPPKAASHVGGSVQIVKQAIVAAQRHLLAANAAQEQAFHLATVERGLQPYLNLPLLGPGSSATLRESVYACEKAITAGDDMAAATALTAVARQAARLGIPTSQSARGDHPASADSIATLQHTIANLGLSASDQASIAPLLNAVSTAETAGDATATMRALRELRAMVEFANTPITLNLLVLKGTPTCIERTDPIHNTTAWYVVVNATSLNGTATAVPITSSETGAHAWATKFATRVTHDEYTRLTAEKAAGRLPNGVIIATKAARSLHFDYSVPSLDGAILSW